MGATTGDGHGAAGGGSWRGAAAGWARIWRERREQREKGENNDGYFTSELGTKIYGADLGSISETRRRLVASATHSSTPGFMASSKGSKTVIKSPKGLNM
jgi:hypothetical protein